MLKRVRRTTVCKVELLEGRIVPSAIASKADVIGNSSATLHLNGYTTLPVHPGEHLQLSVVEHGKTHHPPMVAGRVTTVVVEPTIHPGDSGAFSATIHVAIATERFFAGGELEVDAGLLSGRRVVERYFSQVRVTQD
jgi:hypothetical protein